MNKIMRSVILAVIGVALSSLSASVGAATLEGTVKDASGRTINGAVVRIEAKNFNKAINTDVRGHYSADGLAVGAYKVTLLVNGQVKASILDAKTQNKKPTQLNFDLTGKSMTVAPARKKTHMVYVGGTTGTLGGRGGKWIEADENGVPVNDAQGGATSENVENIGTRALQNMMRPSTGSRGPGGN